MTHAGASRARGLATAFAFSVTILLPSHSILGADNIWIDSGGGSWEDTANWSLGIAPTNADSMYITNSGTYTVNIDNTTADTGSSTTWLTVSNLTVGANGGIPTLLVDFTNANRSVLVRQHTAVGTNANGQGSLIISNGSFVSGTMAIGTTAGGMGTLNLYGGTLRVTNAVATLFIIGPVANSTGLVQLVGGTIAATNSGSTSRTIIGSAGYGRMVISNGTLYTRAQNVGGSGYGELILKSGGTNVSNNGQSFVVAGDNGDAVLVVDGGSLQVIGASHRSTISSGNNSHGTLIVSNGTASFAGQYLQVGNGGGSTGDLKLFGGTTTVTTTTFAFGVGDATHKNRGTVLVDGGFLNSTGTILLGYTNGVGVVDVRNGTLLANGITAGQQAIGTGLVSVVGGTVMVTNAANSGTIDIGSIGLGRLVLSNGVTTTDRLVASNGANSAITFAGGTLNVESTAISNGSSFVVGNGLSTANLHLQGGMHSFANGLSLNTNSTLSGDGFSTLTLGGNMALISNSTFVVDLMTNVANSYDRAFVTGTVALAESILSLRITNFTAAVGSQFTIIDNDGTGDAVTGFFRGLTNNAFIDASSANGPGAYFNILYDGGDGNDVVLLVTIPESNATILSLLAAGGILAMRRAREKTSTQ